jgi:hypothetical protein
MLVLAAGLLAAGLLGAAGPAAADPAVPAPTGPPAAAGPQARLSTPDTALGPDWRGSSDTLVTGVGDSTGYHLYVARENDAFAWTTLATLTASALDLGPWTGQVCVTGSGRYAVAVYAPALAVNKPNLLLAGALAAVVDLGTGTARTVATGVQLAYFDPACGPGDRALLTRAIGPDGNQTDLLTVDAAAGRVTGTRRVGAQLTTPVPAPDGDYGIAHGDLVKVDATGGLTTVARPAGQPFAVVATARRGVDLVSVSGDRAVAQRYADGRLTTVGTGPWDRLQLFPLAGGRDALVGDVAAIGHPPADMSTLDSDGQVQAVSGQGHLLAVRMVTGQAAAAVDSPLSRTDPHRAGTMRVTVRATHTGTTATATVTTTGAPTLDGLPSNRGILPHTDPNVSTPVCAVPRDDPAAQVLQPSPNMITWAVGAAVHGSLTLTRPANYLKTGQPAYSPQGMFPRQALATGGLVPAQVMLGILAQESNLSQASWHAVPGDLGNPLVADYYGNGGDDVDTINYSAADCGYGIAQVTDGMRVDGTTLTHAQQVAVATDYAANIAAGLNILIGKWNQLYNDTAGHSLVNGGNPSYVENWYLAVWAYNSGYHDSSQAAANNGAWGVGWLNNPANPVYPANRDPFLRDSYGDASVPSHWSYEEKVMGWIETPQRQGGADAYPRPTFGSAAGGRLTLPGLRTFCAVGVNDCDPTVTAGDPCQAQGDYCWWHGTSANFASCATQCATEFRNLVSRSEPPLVRVYPTDCETFTGSGDLNRDTSRATTVVYDLNDTSQYALGCAVQPSGGTFTLGLGSPPGSDPAKYYAQIDLHQLGAGYDGHLWFTHVYPPASATKHQVIGTWTPTLASSGRYDVVAHLPSHGGAYGSAAYAIGAASCVISQDTAGADEWVYLGNYALAPGASVQLSNIGPAGADGTVDIAYDAMAFVPTVGSGGSHCGDPY